MNTASMIQSLYPEDAHRVESGVQALLTKYQFKVATSQRLSQRDAIMITYGDAFVDDDGPPLDCLRRFAIAQLGDAVSAIHLLPCFPYTSDDGFSVQDYYRINPALGGWDDVQAIGESYQLMFDAVVNHISQHSQWFQSFLAGDPKYDDYFLVADPSADYSSVTRPRALPLLHPYQRGDQTVSVWTTFSQDQVDLNFHSADVFVQVLDVLLFYVSRGARYIRLDAIAFIWKQLGTSCMHLPQTHQIIQLYRHFIQQIAPHVVIITETNVPHHENVSYFGDGYNEAHLVYNFTLPPLLMHSLHKQDVTVLTQWAQSLDLPSDQVCFFNFTASHDGVGVRPLQGIVPDDDVEQLAAIAREHGGFVSMRDNGDGTQSPYEINCNYFDFATSPQQSDALRVQRFLLTQSVMLAMPGVPGIYYHSLVGSQNDRQAAIDSGINRRINRQKLNYTKLKQELAVAGSIRHSVFTRYKQMLSVRSEQPAFDPYGPAEYEQHGSVFLVKRGIGDDRVMTLHNFSDQPATVQGIDAGAVDLLTGIPVAGDSVSLQPFEFRWLK
ncbi:alpha-amylase family glycosyl hydrolase [Stieleria sp. TO1_6]|uniref:alpha-amylase family glycosyl hydrolase n=1 Tax=Stieleria tagensis TaxID=2956795 RepID=UPI00209B46ED|nr:alpha-amylase family glycosyl hydrolase [Stieleria tagensis]MCO8121359.1 alpha-amylase family glycosyl hydrolase [Stieleria tagensis]